MTIDPGFSKYERVFERAEMTRALEALDRSELDRTRAGARHVLRLPAVRELSQDRRLLAIATAFLGASAIPFRATLFDKSPSANWLIVWHQDTALPLTRRTENAEWGKWSTKAGVVYAHAPAWALERIVALRVSLDDSTASNGPLRVLPDSHRLGVLTAAQVDQQARQTPPVDCLAAAGGVIAMRPLIVHASSKCRNGAQPRRVLHIEFAADLHLGADIDLAVG